MFDALKKYAVFTGRASRKEFWLFILFVIIASIVAMIIDTGIGAFDEEAGMGPVGGLVTLTLLIPSIAVSVRRLHDTDRSGWWYLLAFANGHKLILFPREHPRSSDTSLEYSPVFFERRALADDLRMWHIQIE